MKLNLQRLLPIIALALMGLAAVPAQAGRLVTISGETKEKAFNQTKVFKLSSQSVVTVGHQITQLSKKDCAVQVRIYRRQGNRWLVVCTVLNTNKSANGSRDLKLSRGDYRIQVTAKYARFNITLDRQDPAER